MYSITSKINSAFGMIGKDTADEMIARVVGKNSSFRFSLKNEFEQAVMHAAKHVWKILNIFWLLDRLFSSFYWY